MKPRVSLHLSKITMLVIGLALVGILASWKFLAGAHYEPNRGNSNFQLGEAEILASNIVNRAKLSIRGGVGIIVGSDTQTGLVKIQSVATGSPAAAAGLVGGESISEVNGRSVLGLPLTEVADRIRGLNGTEVRLTVQKPGSTNWVTVVLRRVSMKKAIELNTLNRRSPYE